MAVETRGRSAPTPPPPFAKGTGKLFTGAYSWNAPREAVGRERPLTRDELRQVQGVLSKIDRLPYFLSSLFTSRYEYIRRNKSPVHGLYFLKSTFLRRLWPRIKRVNQRNEMNTDASLLFLAESENYARLPGMNDKELKKFAARIASQIFIMYEELSDAWEEAHGGKESLFTDEAQAHLYGYVAGASRAFNVTPLFWKKYRKGQMTIRQAYSGVARLMDDEWWINQLKAQRMRWHEALLIAAGEVNKDRSPYASKHAVRDVHSRRLANLEYLKSCELENKVTGERIDLISKVMGSISNPEIRRMELMNTIAGIERYAAAEGDVGMFITLTAPSKYHPTRQVGKGKEKTVQLNHGWNGEAYTPKDAQRYLCRIWSLMRTAFKDNDLRVYGMRVVEPHHDGTPHWHMMLFCKRQQRKEITEIMRRYALKEDGDERGAARNRFQVKHLNKGGAAGYIAKYIAKISTVTRLMVSSITIPESRSKIPPPLLLHGRQRGESLSLSRLACRRWALTVSCASCLAESVLLTSLTSVSKQHAPRLMAVISTCISPLRAAQMFRATARPSGSPVASVMRLTTTKKISRGWSVFTRLTSARVTFTLPGYQNGASFQRFWPLRL